MSVDSEFERSEDEDSNGRVRASKSQTCETSPARGSSRPKAKSPEKPTAPKMPQSPPGRGQKRSRGAHPRLREVSAKIGFLEPYVGQEPELIETGNREVLIFVVTVLELEVKVFVEAEIGADRIHVVGSC